VGPAVLERIGKTEGIVRVQVVHLPD
jgi:hypothetical protein